MAKKKRRPGKKIAQQNILTPFASPVHSKYASYPSNGLTPQKLTKILRAADDGDIALQMELYEEMEEKDPHLFSQLQTRKNAVTGLDFEVIAAGDDPIDREVEEFIKNQLAAIENMEEIFMDLLDAIGKGIAISEIIWDYSAKDEIYFVKAVKHHPQKLFFWDEDDRLKMITKDHPEGEFLAKRKFIIHKYKARSGHPSRAGVIRVVSWMYLFKNYALKDWSTFAEVYGMPIRLGKYDVSASEADKIQLMETLYRLASDAAGILPTNSDIEIKESQKTTSVEVFEKLARYADEQISKAVLGQTLTSDSGSGSYAQSKTHNEVREDLLLADCKALAATIKRDLLTPMVQLNFGVDVRVPTIRFDVEDNEDLDMYSKVLSTLINEIGLPIPLNFIYKKFSIPIPDVGDEVAGGKKEHENRVLRLKSDEPPQDYHKKTEALAEGAIRASGELFEQNFEPLRKLFETEASLESVQAMLRSEKKVSELLDEMDRDDMQRLLYQTMLLADLYGRMTEHEIE